MAMHEVINVREAKAQFSRLVEKAHAGEEIILGKAGKPYARLVPLPRGNSRRKLGRLKGKPKPAFFEPLPVEELAAWDGR